jgi:hypothetical protein
MKYGSYAFDTIVVSLVLPFLDNLVSFEHFWQCTSLFDEKIFNPLRSGLESLSKASSVGTCSITSTNKASSAFLGHLKYKFVFEWVESLLGISKAGRPASSLNDTIPG